MSLGYKKLQENLVALKKGDTIVKYTKGGASHKRVFYLSATEHELAWGKKKSSSNSSINITDVSRVQKGANTQSFKKNIRSDNEVFEKRTLSVMLPNRESGSLDLEFQTTEQRDLWADTLQWCVDNLRSGGNPEILFLRKVWTDADTDGNGKLSKKEIRNLLKTLNINASKSASKQLFKDADDDNSGSLDFDEFVSLHTRLMHRAEFEDIFTLFGKGETQETKAEEKFPIMRVENFLSFLKDCNGQTHTEESIEKVLCELFPTRQRGTPLAQDDFIRYLCSNDNQVVDPHHLEIYQDMTLPLTDYFIASSHNTYLEGDQLKGKSSVNTYIDALHLGCRCVELDCWDGQDGEPIIYHGFTLTSKILFRDVIQAIDEHAFKTSPYPVILSLENHCSIAQQKKMAEIMKSVFGDKLAKQPADDCGLEKLPSPEELKFKILLKGKRLKHVASEEDGASSSSDDDSDLADDDDDSPMLRTGTTTELKVDEAAIQDIKKRRKEVKKKKVKLSEDLSRLIYLHAVHFNGFEADKLAACKPWEMSSFAESKFLKFSNKKAPDFVRYNQKQFSRCYPAGKRVNSSNYNPVRPWAMGCQIVALNYQTPDEPMCINEGKFQVNGRSGYVVQPEFLRGFPYFDLRAGVAKYTTLSVQVFSGSHLPKPRQQNKGEVVDPYVRVAVHGLPSETQHERTSTIVDNGFNPVWGSKFVFKVSLPELSMISFMVYDEDKVSADDFLASNSFPINEIREGYRFVRLRNQRHKIMPKSGLFVHFEMRSD